MANITDAQAQSDAEAGRQERPSFGPCAMGCGKQAERGWRGADVCWFCWHWQKLGRPEARYWTEAIEHLFVNEFGSGPDLNDYQQWKEWGIRDEVVGALNTLEALRKRYQELLDNKGQPKKGTEE